MPSFESANRQNVPPPEPVSEEMRAKLLKRDREEVSGVRQKPQEHPTDRAEYVGAREIRRAAQPDVEHHLEKVRIRTPEELKQMNQLREQIQNPHFQQFEHAADQSTAQAGEEINRLAKMLRGSDARTEDIQQARDRLIPMLTYLREQLQPYGLNMPDNERTRKAMEKIHFAIVNIGEFLYEADRRLRNEQRRTERAGGEYSMLAPKRETRPSDDPELRRRQELWGQYNAPEKKKKEESGWGRFKSGLKTFFGLK